MNYVRTTEEELAESRAIIAEAEEAHKEGNEARWNAAKERSREFYRRAADVHGQSVGIYADVCLGELSMYWIPSEYPCPFDGVVFSALTHPYPTEQEEQQ
jgi:hypothetical protein